MSSLVTLIVDGLAEQARRDIAKSRSADAERPVGEVRLDIDFYSPADRDKPIEDYDFHAHGHHYQGTGARWCVAKYRWTGTRWRRVRRISGPLLYTPALDRCTQECKRLVLKRVGAE